MVADRVEDPFLLELPVEDPVEKTGHGALRPVAGRVARIDEPVAAGMLAAEHLAVLGGRTVLEEQREQLRKRIALLLERVERIEPLAAEIELDPVAEHGGGQRLAVAREDGAPLGRQLLEAEDPVLEPSGVPGDLGAELHPDQTQQHHRADHDEQHVEQAHPQQNIALYFRRFLLHIPQSSITSAGTSGSARSMSRRRSSSRIAEWVVRR